MLGAPPPRAASERLVHEPGLDGADSVRSKKDSLRSCDDELLPYLLVDQFAKYNSKIATMDFAKGVLADEVLETCRKNEEDYDTTPLLFAIYHNSWSDLRLVFHLDKIHKSGFARMKLKDMVRRPRRNFEEFLQPETVREILDAFDKAKGDGRTSEFKNVVIHNGHHLVFIRRAERPDLVLRAAVWSTATGRNGSSSISLTARSARTSPR